MAEHKTKVKKADDPEFENLFGEAWDAVCTTCGWTQRRSSEERANASCDEHQAEQASPGDETTTTTVTAKKPARRARARKPKKQAPAPAATGTTGGDKTPEL